MCFDTETTSLNEMEAQIVGLAFSWEVHKGCYKVYFISPLIEESEALDLKNAIALEEELTAYLHAI